MAVYDYVMALRVLFRDAVKERDEAGRARDQLAESLCKAHSEMVDMAGDLEKARADRDRWIERNKVLERRLEVIRATADGREVPEAGVTSKHTYRFANLHLDRASMTMTITGTGPKGEDRHETLDLGSIMKSAEVACRGAVDLGQREVTSVALESVCNAIHAENLEAQLETANKDRDRLGKANHALEEQHRADLRRWGRDQKRIKELDERINGLGGECVELLSKVRRLAPSCCQCARYSDTAWNEGQCRDCYPEPDHPHHEPVS
jgi:hypothetical protein